MNNCEQMKNLSVLEHGYSVAKYYRDLRNHILNGEPLTYEWKLPEWIYDKKLWESEISLRDIYKYQIFHDCGKPYCITFDEEGRKHFPDHANISYEISKSFFNKDVSMLIKNDMASHLTKPSEYEAFMKLPHYKTLLITGLCEIHSNATMFGGIESTSFKMKYKKLTRLGKNVVKNLNNK